MLFSKRYDTYDAFAWFYDRYWGSAFADRYYEVVDRLLLSEVKPGSNLLDLCCGSGELASRLAAAGYRTSGIDGSSALIRLAKRRAPQADLSTGDARSFTIIDKYDGVLCTYDSLNHVMDLVSVGNVFNNVYSALKKNGRFVFDITLEEGFTHRWRGSASVIERDHVIATQSSYDEAQKEGRMEIATFIEQRHWVRTDVTITERCYTKDEITARLSKSLFRDIKTFDAHRDFGSDEVGRLFFVCVK